jgi:hypothetical protein
MSRKTFRNMSTDVCYQRVLRDTYAHEDVPPVPHLDLSKAIIKPVSRKTAEQIILKYEWLGTTAPGCRFHYGIFFGMFCAGVTSICTGGGGANVYAFKEFDLLEQNEFAYLARGANVHWAPQGANSKLISWSCKLLKHDSDAKLIIAYADTDAGEIGTVYQASNWFYIGKGKPTRQWVSPAGKVHDQKLPSNLAHNKGGTRASWVQRLKDLGWYEQLSNPKYRYVQIIDKKDKQLRKLIQSMSQDYPKRVSHESETRGRSAAGGTSAALPKAEVRTLPARSSSLK